MSFFNENSSKWLSVVCKVPQGSILGPTIFLDHINDMPLVPASSDVFRFAYDTNVVSSCSGLCI